MEEDHNGRRTGMTGRVRSLPKIQGVPRERTVTQLGDVGPGHLGVQMLPDLGCALDRDQDKEGK